MTPERPPRYQRRQETIDRLLTSSPVAVGDTVEHTDRLLGPHEVIGLGVANASSPKLASLYVTVQNIRKDQTLGKYVRVWTIENVRKVAK